MLNLVLALDRDSMESHWSSECDRDSMASHWSSECDPKTEVVAFHRLAKSPHCYGFWALSIDLICMTTPTAGDISWEKNYPMGHNTTYKQNHI